MARKKDDNLDKKTLNLNRGDFEKMGELFPDRGASQAIRELVARFVKNNYNVRVSLPDVGKLKDI